MAATVEILEMLLGLCDVLILITAIDNWSPWWPDSHLKLMQEELAEIACVGKTAHVRNNPQDMAYLKSSLSLKEVWPSSFTFLQASLCFGCKRNHRAFRDAALCLSSSTLKNVSANCLFVKPLIQYHSNSSWKENSIPSILASPQYKGQLYPNEAESHVWSNICLFIFAIQLWGKVGGRVSILIFPCEFHFLLQMKSIPPYSHKC